MDDRRILDTEQVDPPDAVEQIGVMGQTNAVGVDHHDVDRPTAGISENLFEVRMNRRFAAGKLKDLGAVLEAAIDRVELREGLARHAQLCVAAGGLQLPFKLHGSLFSNYRAHR